MTRLLVIACACLLAAVTASAERNIQNARIQQRAAADLAQTFQQLAREGLSPVPPGNSREHADGSLAFWIAYAVPAHSPDWNACCSGDSPRGCCTRCALEERQDGTTESSIGRTGPIELEPDTSAVILYRVEGGRVVKIRTYSDSCELDAGGRTVYWLTGVNPAASVALLKSMLTSPEQLPNDAAARRSVSQVLFAISAHQAPEAVATLVDLARNDPQPKVRSDALFWLAQRAGAKAAGTITDAIANDPDTKVKERAVFALSQLPRNEGVPELIDVARNNRNPRVRRQAVFWLGQSKDPRALRFFEEILK